MKAQTKETLRIYLRHAAKYKWLGFFVVALQIAQAAVSMIQPMYYKRFLDTLIGVTSGDVYMVLVGMGAVFLLRHSLRRSAEFGAARFLGRVMEDLANTCYDYLQRHSYGFFNNNFVGSLVKRVSSFVHAYDVLFDRVVWDIVAFLVKIVVISYVLSLRSTILVVILLAWVFLFLIVNGALTRVKFRYDVEQSKAGTNATGVLADSITNNINVKLFAGYGRESARYGAAQKELKRLRIFCWTFGVGIDAAQGILVTALEIGVLYATIGLWRDGILTPGDFVLIQAYLLLIFDSIWDFGRVIRAIYENLSDAEEMTEIISAPHEVVDAPGARALSVRRGAVDFQKVDFNYRETRAVLKDFSMSVRPQEKVALVGPSGAGKSTLAKLLLRLYDVSGGAVLIDGQNIARVSQESLWKRVSMVPQDPILFHRTIRENIRYGKPRASDKEVVVAAKLAHCHEFISSFPDGYDTYVGERGVKLSGGERQRVAIARTILRDSPILLLDEATSSLDSESERFIQESLRQLMEGKTVIVIAHRLSTIMRMDRVVVLADGGIAEEGAHAELIARPGGVYSRLWRLQAGGFLPADAS